MAARRGMSPAKKGKRKASKAAAAMVSKTLAVRLGPENIAVYDVQPGLIATEMTAPVIESYRTRAAAGLTLLPRVGEPAEMGAIIAPPVPAFYTRPQTVDELVTQTVGRALDLFDLDHEQVKRWRGEHIHKDV